MTTNLDKPHLQHCLGPLRRLACVRVVRGCAVVAVAVFFLSLAWSAYETRQALDSSLSGDFLLQARADASLVGLSLAERMAEMESLAGSSPVTAYFDNEALGMSRDYGLRLSLHQVDSHLRALQHRRVAMGHPLYQRLVLADSQGAVLADTGATGADRSIVASVVGQIETGFQHPIQKLLAPASGELLVVTPTRRGDETVGWVLCWLNLHATTQLSMAHPQDRALLLREQGGWRIVSDHLDERRRQIIDRAVLAATPLPDLAQNLGAVALMPITATPLHLACLRPAEQTHSLGRLRWYPYAVLLLAAGVLATLLLLFRKTTRLLLLENSYQEQKREEARLLAWQVETLRFRTGVEQSVDGIALSDMEGRIEFVNQSWAAMHGYRPEELVGRPLAIFHNEEQLRQEVLPSLEWIARNQSFSGEIGHMRRDGSLFPTHMTTSVLRRDDQAPIGMIAIARDITDLHNKEKELQTTARTLEEKNRELEEFVYVASHDLRSPLVNVDGFSREIGYSLQKIAAALDEGGGLTALHGALSAELPEMDMALNHIRNSAAQMDRLLKGLLKISRTGRAALVIERVDMDELMRQITSTLAYRVAELSVELTVERLPDCLGDTLQLSQVFANLLGNAVKYLHKDRQGRVRVSGALQGGRAVYVIEDNGLGIAAEHQENIFKLFHRLHPQESEGEGLGLPIVRQILGRLGGEIAVHSTVGEGSRFIVSLPPAERESR